MANNIVDTDVGESNTSIPERVQDYVDISLLQNTNPVSKAKLNSKLYGYRMSTYKATHIGTNQYVILRRVHSFLHGSSKSLAFFVDAWKKVNCVNIVRLLDVFPTKAFGNNTSLILVYQYFTPTTSIMQQYFNEITGNSITGGPPSMYRFGAQNMPFSQQNALIKNKLIPENLIWHYIIQISSALRMIHSAKLAHRLLSPSEIIITSNMPKCAPIQLNPSQYPRVRLNICGLLDILTHDNFLNNDNQEFDSYAYNLSLAQYQRNDLIGFGRTCLTLSTSSLRFNQEEHWQMGIESLTRNNYSNDLKCLILTLLYVGKDGTSTNINDIMPMIGARFYASLNLAYEALDARQAELDREMLNGKLFRMIVKLNMINERPELRFDPLWSETGDRYMLKLFRDYLFHQSNEDGSPWLDSGHVVATLCKFDVGSPDKICLISRDEQHILVVSFKELRECFDRVFNELVSGC